MSNESIDPENTGLDTKITWLGQIMKELGYFRGTRVPADNGQQAGYTLAKLPDNHRGEI